MNVAKAHARTQGLVKFAIALQEIHNLAKDGVVSGNRDLFLQIRDKSNEFIGVLLSIESKLEQLDKNSPCLKCKKVKEESWQ
jgi:hypothetical protein